jgi:hypothetical protein
LKVSITDKEVQALREAAELSSMVKGKRGADTPLTKTLLHLVEKCTKAADKAVKKPSELALKDFMNMARVILGPRFKEQLKVTPAWYKQMQMRLDSRGINKAMASVALENARDSWIGDIWVDTLINSLDKLAVMTPKNTKKTNLGWLNQIETDDDKYQETE